MKPTSPSLKAAQTLQERQALSRLRQLLNEPGMLRASLVRCRRLCGKDSCRCAQDKRHRHASWYLGHCHKGKSETQYLHEETVPEVRAWVERYREVEALMGQISHGYWERLKKYRR